MPELLPHVAWAAVACGAATILLICSVIGVSPDSDDSDDPDPDTGLWVFVCVLIGVWLFACAVIIGIASLIYNVAWIDYRRRIG